MSTDQPPVTPQELKGCAHLLRLAHEHMTKAMAARAEAYGSPSLRERCDDEDRAVRNAAGHVIGASGLLERAATALETALRERDDALTAMVTADQRTEALARKLESNEMQWPQAEDQIRQGAAAEARVRQLEEALRAGQECCCSRDGGHQETPEHRWQDDEAIHRRHCKMARAALATPPDEGK